MGRPRRVPIAPQLAQHRRRIGLTQDQVAERLGITVDMVRRHEKGTTTPVLRSRLAYCELYGADEVMLGFRAAPGPAFAIANVSTEPDDVEDVLAIMERVQRLDHASIGGDTLDLLDVAIDDIVTRYEAEGPRVLAGPLLRQRRVIDRLIDQCGHPAERMRLYQLAGKTSALLGYVAVNRSQYPMARAYCAEAFKLGEYADARDLQAWVRGTQSFCEYYAGDYATAADLARDGLRFADSGDQSIRLLINGEARALGKLGDSHGVHRTVAAAYHALDSTTEVAGVSPCVSFGAYSRARTASNAVTAYVDLGDSESARAHAGIATPEFDASNSRWSRALIRLDLANALVRDAHGDPDEAAALVTEALETANPVPITSVVQRSQSFMSRSMRRWKDAPSIRALRDTVSSTQVE